MKSHTDEIIRVFKLPKYTRFECITSKTEAGKDRIVIQFAYKAYFGHDMRRFLVSVVDYVNFNYTKIRVTENVGSRWHWLGNKIH